MSFFDRFAKPAAPAQQPAPNSPLPGQSAQQQQAASQQGQQPNGQQPNGEQTPNSQSQGSNATPNPMDVYNKMFQNDPNKKEEGPPTLKLDPAVLDKVTGSMDFMKGVPAELMAKAQAGDIPSLFEVMQHSNRAAYRAALEHGNALTDTFVGQREDHFRKGVPNVVRDELTIGALTGDGSKGAMHPVVRQQLIDVAKMLQKANPDASPQEIAATARKYIKDMNDQVNPTQPSEANSLRQKEAQGTDWDAYFDNDPAKQGQF